MGWYKLCYSIVFYTVPSVAVLAPVIRTLSCNVTSLKNKAVWSFIRPSNSYTIFSDL